MWVASMECSTSAFSENEGVKPSTGTIFFTPLLSCQKAARREVQSGMAWVQSLGGGRRSGEGGGQDDRELAGARAHGRGQVGARGPVGPGVGDHGLISRRPGRLGPRQDVEERDLDVETVQ